MHKKEFIEIKFTYHPPKILDLDKYQEIRDKAKEFAFLIEKKCPKSTEKNIAIDKLREVMMWANASIALN